MLTDDDGPEIQSDVEKNTECNYDAPAEKKEESENKIKEDLDASLVDLPPDEDIIPNEILDEKVENTVENISKSGFS